MALDSHVSIKGEEAKDQNRKWYTGELITVYTSS